MPQLTVAESARATGKDRSTIHRHIKGGRLSADKDAQGRVVIDTSELLRVYGELRTDGQKPPVQDSDANEAIKAIREELQNAREREQWFRAQLEAAQERIKELEQRIPLALPPKPGWFSRFFN